MPAVGVLLLIAGCSTTPAPPSFEPPVGTASLPTWSPDPSGPEPGCGGIGLNHVLRGNTQDARLAWLEAAQTGERLEVMWPAGAQATFGPHLIVLDAEGNTLAQEGDHIDGACTFDSGVVLLGWP
jgi:hypothetical protein